MAIKVQFNGHTIQKPGLYGPPPSLAMLSVRALRKLLLDLNMNSSATFDAKRIARLRGHLW